MFQTGRPHGLGNQGITRGVALVSIVTNDLLGDFVLPILTTFGPEGLEVLVHIRGMFPTGDALR